MGMPAFDALLISFSLSGIGGFFTSNRGAAVYSAPSAVVVMTVFMFLFAMNYGLFFLLFTGKFKKVGREIVETDGHITTAKGPATTPFFALRLLELLRGKEVADEVSKAFLVPLIR